MFATNLRKRPFGEKLVPRLLSDSHFRFKETDQDRFDLAIPFKKDHLLHILVLSNVEVDSQLPRVDEILKSPRSSKRLVFLVNEGPDMDMSMAVNKLQFHLLNYDNLPALLPIPSVEDLLPCLKSYLENANKLQEQVHAQVQHPTSAIAVATAASPYRSLTQNESELVYNIFGSIEGLCRAVKTGEAQNLLARYFDARTVRDLSAFWEEEYTI